MMKDEGRNAEKPYDYWLCSIPGVGERTICNLLKRWGSAQEIYHRLISGQDIGENCMTPKQSENVREHVKKWDLHEEYEKLQRGGISFFTVRDPEYPERLRMIPDAPFAIFVKGGLPKDEIMSVAVIGARECSAYGSFVAGELAGTLGRRGVQVVSGMARGIDSISEEAALSAGGSSFAVLGSGVDVCYPAENRRLYDKLIKDGGVISPYLPGTAAKASLFPPRNRIVSGLSDAVVVVEARERSGTLITVDMALEQGREVYVVPGRLTDRLSDGCNRMIRQGAGIILSPSDFLAELVKLFPRKKFGSVSNIPESVKDTKNMSSDPASESGRDEAEKKILDNLDFYPKDVEEICALFDPPMPYRNALQILMRLVLSGDARQAGPGEFQRVKP